MDSAAASAVLLLAISSDYLQPVQPPMLSSLEQCSRLPLEGRRMVIRVPPRCAARAPPLPPPRRAAAS